VSGDSRSAEVQAALVSSAAQFARNAVGAYLDEEYEVFLMHAATASEHLLKASLCGRSVALIAEATRSDDRHFRSLAALLGLELPARGPVARQPERAAQSIRTIGAEEALRRVGAFMPRLTGARENEGLRELFAQRNGVVHLGEVAARSDAVRLRSPFVAACELLLADIGHEPRRFWGENHEIAARWAQQADDEAEQAVHDKLDAARRRYELGAGGIAPMVMYEHLMRDHDPLTEAIIDCPACGLPCTVSGYPEEAAAGAEAAFELLVTNLDCAACHLYLSGSDLPRAGVPSRVPLPGVDERMVNEFYEEELGPRDDEPPTRAPSDRDQDDNGS
jgi:hypothetical protein